VPIGTAAAAFAGIVLLVLWPVAGRAIRAEARAPVRWALTRALVAFGSPLALAGLADFFVSQLDVLILQAALPTSQLGQYAAATTIGRSLVLLFGVASYAYAPAFAAALGPGGTPTRRVYEHELNDFRFLSAVLAGTIALLAPEAVALLFGHGFAQASVPLILIALGYLLVNLQGFNSYHLLLAGRSGIYAVSRIAVVVIGVLFYILLVPAWGLFGAAVGSSLTVVLAASSAAFLSQRKLGTPTTPPVSLLYALPVLAALLLQGEPITLRGVALFGSLALALAVRRIGARG
jgi:O-antigen/teichoic acid export membrane protein